MPKSFSALGQKSILTPDQLDAALDVLKMAQL